MGEKCFYCQKEFLPNDVLTSDEGENTCHVDCDNPKLTQSPHPSKDMTKNNNLPEECLICGAGCGKVERDICLAAWED